MLEAILINFAVAIIHDVGADIPRDCFAWDRPGLTLADIPGSIWYSGLTT